jgi:hypothetical protein
MLNYIRYTKMGLFFSKTKTTNDNIILNMNEKSDRSSFDILDKNVIVIECDEDQIIKRCNENVNKILKYDRSYLIHLTEH